VAPAVLADLGLDYNLLDGVRLEGAQLLPGLFAVPVPSTWAMMLLGFAGVGLPGTES
jgi:hypothetical protein